MADRIYLFVYLLVSRPWFLSLCCSVKSAGLLCTVKVLSTPGCVGVFVCVFTCWRFSSPCRSVRAPTAAVVLFLFVLFHGIVKPAIFATVRVHAALTYLSVDLPQIFAPVSKVCSPLLQGAGDVTQETHCCGGRVGLSPYLHTPTNTLFLRCRPR